MIQQVENKVTLIVLIQREKRLLEYVLIVLILVLHKLINQVILAIALPKLIRAALDRLYREILLAGAGSLCHRFLVRVLLTALNHLGNVVSESEVVAGTEARLDLLNDVVQVKIVCSSELLVAYLLA